jgi:hypothetical protein
MRILDMSAGNRAIWIEKAYPDAVFVDCRESVRPQIVCDTRRLPFADGIFDMVVFDPPHENFGKNGKCSALYGWHTTEEIRDIVKRSSREAWRVTRANSLMLLKWNDHGQRLGKILDVIGSPWRALFGHKVSMKQWTNADGRPRGSSTYWVAMLRSEVYGNDTK